MKITIEMPSVSSCTVTDCAYNSGSACHARAITIGDGVHPGCDTFFGGAGTHTKNQAVAGVGACKVTSCRHNEDFECMTDNIVVGFAGNSVNCMTFESR
ncbi:MAG: DUF1540 domain-containing protein [Chromatiales bacterium]|nr:DUF1540 domain-containing protein [Chromatiales bacterium]